MKLLFYSCLAVSVVSPSAAACVLSPLSSVSRSLMCHVFYQAFLCSCICLYAPFSSPSSCSVSFLSFTTLCLSLSLLSLCWDRVLRVVSFFCPPHVVSFRYYIEFNDINIVKHTGLVFCSFNYLWLTWTDDRGVPQQVTEDFRSSWISFKTNKCVNFCNCSEHQQWSLHLIP